MRKFILKCYAAWIDENVPKDEIVGNCTLWSRVMKQAFPELILVGGYTTKVDPPPGEEEPYDFSLSLNFFRCNYHEYLITEDGDIVDPTAAQFDAMIGRGNWRYDRCEEHLLYPPKETEP